MPDVTAEAIVAVVRKLVGPVQPVGETVEDSRRLENLEKLVEVARAAIQDVAEVTPNANRVEYSMKKAGQMAANFLSEMHIETSPADVYRRG